MAIEHLENWSLYGENGQARLTDGVYVQLNGAVTIDADPDPTATGDVLALNAHSGYGSSFLTYVLNTATSTLGWAMRLYFPAFTYVNQGFMKFYDAALNQIVKLSILPTGQIRVTGPGGGYIGTSNLAQKLTTNGWNHVEAKVHFSLGGGTVEIRVNGVVAFLATNVTTSSSDSIPCSIVRFSSDDDNTSAACVYMKDVVLWNTSGTHNTDFMGAVQVISLIPDSDVTLQWNPNTGTTGFNRINFAPPTDDASYISAPIVGELAQFTLSDLPPNVTAVKGCQLMTRTRKADGGDGNIQAALIHNSSELDGADRPITTAYTYWKDIFEVDPATGGNISPAAMNQMQVKVTRTV